MNNPLSNSRGQSLIETMVVSLAIMTFVSGLSAVLYFGFVHTGMHYLLHETLVCQLTQDHGNCDQLFREHAAPWLFAAELRSFHSTQADGKAHARLQIAMPLGKLMTINKDLELQ